MTSGSTMPSSPTFAGMTLIDAEAVAGTFTHDKAAAALERALRNGVDPEHDGERSRLTTATGELLLMPSTDGRYAGIKVLSSTPDNATHNAPLIQGAYLLFEGPEQRPAAVVDGIALTNARTPAITLLGLRHLLAPMSSDSSSLRAVVFGAGTQAREHTLALATSRVVPVSAVTVVGVEADGLDRIADLIGSTADAENVAVRTFTIASTGSDGVAHQAEIDAAVAEADIIVTCTSAPTALFDGSLVKDDAVVVAMGSHFPTDRETDDALVDRAHVIVESRAATLREAGDVVIPIESGLLDPERITTLRDAVVGDAPPADRPRFFKFTGMPWEDLAVAVGLYEACSGDQG